MHSRFDEAIAPSDDSHHDHRRLLRALDLAHFEPHSPGVVFWHPAGLRVLRRLEACSRNLHESEAYEEVRSPQLLNQSLWERSGHWSKYRENMFVVSDGEHSGALALKPMSCPGHIALFDHRRRSYRELPLRLFEFGAVHRNEPSGSLSGLLRLRGFVQDDAHVFAEPDRLNDSIGSFVRLVEQAYPRFGFERWAYRLALRPAVRAGDDALWDKAETALREACRAHGISPLEVPGEGAFYGPKLEVVLTDRLGREWQCGVIQVDFVLPQNFDLSYSAASGESERPVLLHHAVFGSLERWLAVVLEHHGGLPDGLCPEPVRVLPLSEATEGDARRVWQALRNAGVPAGWDAQGPLSGRLREAAEAHVPLWAVVGPREAASASVSVRRRGQPRAHVGSWQAWVQEVARAWNEGSPNDALPLPAAPNSP